MVTIEAIRGGRHRNPRSGVETLRLARDRPSAGRYARSSATFLPYFDEQEVRGRTFDFTDCALGNLLFAGCYLEQGQRDFNRTIEAFSEFYEVGPTFCSTSPRREPVPGGGKRERHVLLNEADIVASRDAAKISDFLLDETTYRNQVENASRRTGREGGAHLFREAAAHRA